MKTIKNKKASHVGISNNFFIKNKKASHVGVVVSFVIFITFLIFLYSLLYPVTMKERDKSYILDYIKLNLIGNATGNISTMIINVEEPVGPQPCLNLQDIINDERIPEYMVNHLIFKTSEENFTYQRIPNEPKIRVNTGGGFDGIITVFYSEEIIPALYDGPSGCSPKNYPVGYVRSLSEIFETKLYELNESYYADYEGLKAEFGIPEGTEFSFYVYDSERNEPPVIFAQKYPPPTDRSIFSEETPIQYIDSTGNTKFGFLVIKVW